MRLGRLLLSLALALYAVMILRADDSWSLLDNVNLPIHETGHLVFGMFGEQITALGGTLFQLLVPLAFATRFAMQRDWHSSSVMVWWAGQNGVNIGRYMADAVVQELPLVGGGEHDWSFLFGEWNVLAHSEKIGHDAAGIGGVIMLAACAWGALLATRSAAAVPA
jgi:hypothetical protein